MRKEIVNQHLEALLEEKKNHGGELIIIVAYSDQPNDAEFLIQSTNYFVMRAIYGLGKSIQEDEEGENHGE